MSDTLPRTIIATLRHARTDYSAQERYAGTIDVPLSAEGEADCRAAASSVAVDGYDVVVTSDLRRALETARLLGAEPERTVCSALCRERAFGVLEGLTATDVTTLDPPVLFIEVGDDRHSVNPQGGEPFEDVWQRAKDFLDLLFHRFEGSRVLVVSHGVFLQMLHGVLTGSSCIESLADYPGSLELRTFTFVGRDLAAQERRNLTATAGPAF